MGRIEEWTDALAELAVFGANVQPGQLVSVTSYVGKEDLTRRIAHYAYLRGARYVDVLYFDQWVKRERIAHAAEDTLDYSPPWMSERLLYHSDEHAARISLSGPHAPSALEGLDYARAVYPELEEDEAFERLWEAVAHICRLDTDDPPEAWLDRVGVLRGNARRLTERGFDSLRLHGPGTDLTIGLFPSSIWEAGDFHTVDGNRHLPNIPTEETFTTPDPERVDGHVSATMPLELAGSVISGIRVEFEGGRAVKIDAERGADALRSAAASDEGATRLGEIALVDREGRIGPLDTVFFDTLIDENAATHIALGNGYELPVGDASDRERVNKSRVHIDFMIGSSELAVDGVTRDGTTVPVLREGAWQI